MPSSMTNWQMPLIVLLSVADSNRLVSTHLTAALREGRRHLTLEPDPLPAFLQDRLRHLVLHFIEEEVPEF